MKQDTQNTFAAILAAAQAEAAAKTQLKSAAVTTPAAADQKPATSPAVMPKAKQPEAAKQYTVLEMF